MGAWRAQAGPVAAEISERPALWIAGGLAWAATFGPVALALAVTPAPGLSDLTFMGSGAFISGSWPWNLVAAVLVALAIVALALALVAAAEASLLARPAIADLPGRVVMRATLVTIVGALPTLAAAAALALALAAVAPAEFGEPDANGGGPIIRTVARVWPLVAVVVLAATVGGTLSAAARVAVARDGLGAIRAIRATPALVARAGLGSWVHAAVSAVVRGVYLVAATLLLGVLWAPIGAQLAAGAGFGAGEAMLLLGFVAIWICLVLGGGASHAWSSLTWARLIAPPTPAETDASRRREESPSTP